MKCDKEEKKMTMDFASLMCYKCDNHDSNMMNERLVIVLTRKHNLAFK